MTNLIVLNTERSDAYPVEQAAMQSAEDEVDATAAAEAEKEAADELAEFTMEPPSNAHSPVNPGEQDTEVDPGAHQEAKACTDGSSLSDKDGIDDESGSVTSAGHNGENNQGDGQQIANDNKVQLAGVKASEKISSGENAEDDEGFGGLNQGMVGSEEMVLLLEKFLPIEKFAIRSIELVSSAASCLDHIAVILGLSLLLMDVQVHNTVDIEAAALQTLANVEEKDWELDEIEEKKELADQEIDMEDEVWVDAWDRTAATMEYKTEVEAAQKVAEEERKQLVCCITLLGPRSLHLGGLRQRTFCIFLK